jgi:hypothetical protein
MNSRFFIQLVITLAVTAVLHSHPLRAQVRSEGSAPASGPPVVPGR